MGSGVISPSGLPSRLLAVLAYSGWWVSGLLIWHLEQRDRYVRFHAAQSTIVFGAVAVVVTVFSGIAVAALVYTPRTFNVWVWVAAVAWLGGAVLWVMSMWHAATGRRWRLPVAAALADRMCRT